MEWKRAFRILKTLNWVILLLLSSASFFLMGNAFTTGVIMGGFLIIANFNFLQHTVTRAFSPGGVFGANKRAVIGKYYLRMAVLGLFLYLSISQSWINPVGLAVGLSVVIISIVTLGFLLVWEKLPGKVA
jgi:hypothetical protein